MANADRTPQLTILILFAVLTAACGGSEEVATEQNRPGVTGAQPPPPTTQPPPTTTQPPPPTTQPPPPTTQPPPPTTQPPPPTTQPPPPPAANSPPTISGSPATTVLQNSLYSFTPAASDANNNTLTFTITNRPAWASFNTSTGRIQGTPTAADVRTYAGITISVSDGMATTSLAPFSITVAAVGTGSATLSWTAPTQNADGSPLTNLASYRIHWGTSSRNYTESVTISNPGLTTYVLGNLLSGTTYYFATTAGNSLGEFSAYSNEATKTIP